MHLQYKKKILTGIQHFILNTNWMKKNL